MSTANLYILNSSLHAFQLNHLMSGSPCVLYKKFMTTLRHLSVTCSNSETAQNGLTELQNDSGSMH